MIFRLLYDFLLYIPLINIFNINNDCLLLEVMQSSDVDIQNWKKMLKSTIFAISLLTMKLCQKYFIFYHNANEKLKIYNSCRITNMSSNHSPDSRNYSII